MRAAAVADGRDPEDDDPETLFLHDVPAAAIEAATVREQSGTPFEKPWPLAEWPDVPTRFLLCRDDRFFPAEFQRRVVQDRLGIDPRRDGRRPPPRPGPPRRVGRAPAGLCAGGGTPHRRAAPPGNSGAVAPPPDDQVLVERATALAAELLTAAHAVGAAGRPSPPAPPRPTRRRSRQPGLRPEPDRPGPAHRRPPTGGGPLPRPRDPSRRSRRSRDGSIASPSPPALGWRPSPPAR